MFHQATDQLRGFFAQSVEPRIRVEADLPLIQSVNEMGSYLTNRPFAD